MRLDLAVRMSHVPRFTVVGTRLLGLVCLQAWCLLSHAEAILRWEFDPPAQIVGPTEKVVVSATLFNDAASDESIPGDVATVGIGFRWSPSTAAVYLESTPRVGQIGGLAPGQTTQFTFTILTPTTSEVPFGSYSLADTSFQVGGDGWQFILPGPNFTWTVADRSLTTTLSGKELLTYPGVSFPNGTPTQVGDSLAFGPGNSFDKLMVLRLLSPGSGPAVVTLTANLTRLPCDPSTGGCAGQDDSDPHLLLSDGRVLAGFMIADNNNGQAFAVRLDDAGLAGTNRQAQVLFENAGYPIVGDDFDVQVKYVLNETFDATVAYGSQSALTATQIPPPVATSNSSTSRPVT